MLGRKGRKRKQRHPGAEAEGRGNRGTVLPGPSAGAALAGGSTGEEEGATGVGQREIGQACLQGVRAGLCASKKSYVPFGGETDPLFMIHHHPSPHCGVVQDRVPDAS